MKSTQPDDDALSPPKDWWKVWTGHSLDIRPGYVNKKIIFLFNFRVEQTKL